MAQIVLPDPVCHLDQGARAAVPERPLDVPDRLDLHGVEVVLLQRRQRPQACAQRRRPRVAGRRVEAAALGVQALHPGVERLGPEPLGQRLRPVDVGQVRDAAALRIGVETVDEAGLDARADVLERERMDRRVQSRRQAGRVLVRLRLHAGQGVADRLRFENAGRLSASEQHVVGEPVAGAIRNSRTATPSPAARFIRSRFWTTQPASTSAASILRRACCSGVSGMLGRWLRSNRSCSRGGPVLHPQVRHASELARVVRNESRICFERAPQSADRLEPMGSRNVRSRSLMPVDADVRVEA